MKSTPNFQTVLDQYNPEIKFLKLLEQSENSTDELFYKIDTDHGPLLVLEIDYISNLDYIHELFKNKLNQEPEFLLVKACLPSFSDYPPLKESLAYKAPADFEKLKHFLGYKGCSKPYFFVFVAKI